MAILKDRTAINILKRARSSDEEAREILRETRYGKANIITSDFKLKYSDWDIQRSRATVNEYNRLKLLMREV